jgi:hypothetical protein
LGIIQEVKTVKKQEAFKKLQQWIADALANKIIPNDTPAQELQHILEAYRPLTPDPGTGLVSCGCGGELELKSRPIQWPETYHEGRVTNDKIQYWVFCRKCHWSTMDYLSKELAIKHANLAMGYREAEEND